MEWKDLGLRDGFQQPILEATSEDGTNWRKLSSGSIYFQATESRWVEYVPKPVYPAASGERLASVHYTSESNGKFRWHTHNKFKDRADAAPCIPDYACETGRKYWGRYYHDPKTGLAGPMPFGSNAEQKAYEDLTGIRTLEKGETTWNASSERTKAVENCAKLLRTSPAEVERQVRETVKAAYKARKAKVTS